MIFKIEEIYEIVEDFNNNFENNPFEICSYGIGDNAIKFMGKVIWYEQDYYGVDVNKQQFKDSIIKISNVMIKDIKKGFKKINKG